MITMLGLFIVVTYVEQRLIVLPNTAGKRSFMAPTLVNIFTSWPEGVVP